MFIIPRTPVSPSRKLNSTMATPSLSLSPTYESPKFSPPSTPQKDIYDRFIDIYFQQHPKIKMVLLKKITDYVAHPVYTHLLNTMDRDNSHHVMGYLRSQRSFELFNILEQICNNPLPPKSDFFKLCVH